MREKSVRVRMALIAAFVVAIARGCALAQTTTPRVVWPTYHMDNYRLGQNKDCTDISNPASLNLIWVSPRGLKIEDDEELATVDDREGDCIKNPPWKGSGLTSKESRQNHFYWLGAASRTDVDDNGNPNYTPAPPVIWKFPSAMPAGRYQVMIWIPVNHDQTDDEGNPHNTTQAEYTVHDYSGKTTVKFDQSWGGGEWRLLTNRQFDFSGATSDPKGFRVELSNVTDDTKAAIDAGEIVVVADAVRFIPVTGREIYSSVASARIEWQGGWPEFVVKNSKDEDVTIPAGAWGPGIIPAAYACTVEAPLSNAADAPDTGSIYCINSITPYVKSLGDIEKQEGLTEWQKAQGIASLLGTPVWRYPRAAQDRYAGSSVSGAPVPPNDIEGPVEGGIYASPTLAATNDANHPLICYAAGMDRQVYALDATTGELLWKGPGVTTSENDPNGFLSSKATRVEPAEAFGGRYHYIPCSDEPEKAATWYFQLGQQFVDGGPAEGLAYSVYAWIPAAAEPGERAHDALYTITYEDGLRNPTTFNVKVDQAALENQGKWVQLGSSYFNVTSVELSAQTKTIAEGRSADSYVVIADAVMVVPNTIESFGYCTPVVDIEGNPNADPKPLANNVFVVNSAGRAMAFDAHPRSGKIAKLKWIFPKVRTKAQVTGDADIDYPGMGPMNASPAYSRDALYIAGANGKIRKLEGVTSATFGSIESSPEGMQAWEYPADDAVVTQRASFSSSPAIDGQQLVIGSTYGIFYCLNNDNGTEKWRYPDIQDETTPGASPLGGFDFSTPAIADAAGMHRAWIGGKNGKIYSFDLAANATERRLWVEFDSSGNEVATHGTWYVEPSAGSPVQGSVALDGGNGSTKQLLMFVGDMNDKGVMHWYDAKDGQSNWSHDYGKGSGSKVYQGWRTEGRLFSSPNLTNFKVGTTDTSYVYGGGSDGRVYAWSPDGGAWGGRWAGGNWPFAGAQDSGSQSVTQFDQNTDVQFDIFPAAFWEDAKNNAAQCEKKVPSSDLTAAGVTAGCEFPSPFPGAAWPSIVSEKMKKPTDSFAGKTGDTLTGAINDKLLTYAKERRNEVFPSSAARTGSQEPLYFEWGERLCIVVWNLPEKKFLYPAGTGNDSAKRGQIRFNFVNESPGVGGGSQRSFSGTVTVLQEYTVLDNSKPHTRTSPSGPTWYEPLLDGDGNETKRCFALAQIDLRGTGSNPPSPGPNWKLTLEVKKLTSDDKNSPIVPLTIPLAKLKIGSSGAPEPVINTAKTGVAVGVAAQDLGINNPLAIRVGATELAWSFAGNRDDPQAHFNGNAQVTGGNYGSAALSLSWGDVAHGTNSIIVSVGIMDRSATGIPYPGIARQQKLEAFRISGDDLRWNGSHDAISGSGGAFFPWEFRPESVDYPHLYKRYQRYRKHYDDANPSRVPTTLPPLLYDNADPTDYAKAKLRPDTIEASVEVPRFQPANNRGYTATMQAFIDSNRDGSFNSGNIVLGRPTTYQEAYREFHVKVTVPADPRIEVEEQLIDIGQAPHGLGDNLAAIHMDFMSVNPDPAIKQWFKRVTIKNAGNVNLHNIRIGDANAPLYLIKDPRAFGASIASSPVLPGWSVRSSVENVMPGAPFLQGLKLDPFIMTTGLQPFGYTVTKPRVGDPDPTIMSIPDRRKWDADYAGTQSGAKLAYQAALLGAGLNPATADSMQPFPTEVSVSIPVSQPVGTYVAPFVPVYAQFGQPGQGFVGTASAAPTFGLKVTVRESQVTGDIFPASLDQIDSGPLPKFGDAEPAAFRDLATGDVHLFWSSNRVFDDGIIKALRTEPPGSPAFQEFASAPWFINTAVLKWNPASQQNQNVPAWINAGPQWWGIPNPTSPYLPPKFPSSGKQWPLLIGATAKETSVMPWTFNGGNTDLWSVRHHSPFVAENLDVPADATSGRAFLAWAGAANLVFNTSGKITNEHRIFYTDVTHGATSRDPLIFSIEHDPAGEKRSPYLSVFSRGGGENRMWAFWQGSEAGKWSIFCSLNDTSGFPSGGWKEDMKVRTPDCLTSASSPNAVHRVFWANMLGNSPSDAGAKHLFDLVYSGTTKLSQTPDILLGRYAAVGPSDANADARPGSAAQPMPRVFGEKLQRDSKYGFYTSEHLAWVRLNAKRVAQGQERPVLDDWGNYNITVSNPDLPYIRVYFPNGYEIGSLPPGSFVSGTDGHIIGPNGAIIYAPPTPLSLDTGATESDFRLQIDQATGLYTYKYPKGSLPQQILGDTLVDFSAGIVRFTNPLKEAKDPADPTRFIAPEVRADYTPLTWRLTTDMAVDNSPRAFVERTTMNPRANPGMVNWTGPVPPWIDRLWVLWRRAGTAVESSTIFWKTYRVGIDLSKFRDANGNPLPPIPMNPDGAIASSANLRITNNLGPWEVDRSGTRIYFTQVDERYRSLFKAGSNAFFTNPAPPDRVWSGGLPVPITVSYKDGDGTSRGVSAHDVFWLNELPEQSLFGFVGNASVNEGSVHAFADTYNENVARADGTFGPREYSKIWVFWTTTRGGTSDLCWADLSPNFAAR